MRTLDKTWTLRTIQGRRPARAALAVGLLVGTVWLVPSPAAGADTGTTLSFVERHHDAALDQTTFTYRLVTGDAEAVQKVVLGFGLCSRPDVLAAWPTPGGAVRGLNRPIIDRASGIQGVRWDGWFAASTHNIFSYTIAGDVPLGVVRTAIRSAVRQTRQLVSGPDCLAASPEIKAPAAAPGTADEARLADHTPGRPLGAGGDGRSGP